MVQLGPNLAQLGSQILDFWWILRVMLAPRIDKISTSIRKSVASQLDGVTLTKDAARAPPQGRGNGNIYAVRNGIGPEARFTDEERGSLVGCR